MYRFWNLVAAFFGATLVVVAAVLLLTMAVDPSASSRVWGALMLLLFAAVFAGLLAWFRRRESDSDRAVTRAVKHAELPPDADPKVWNALLLRRQSQLSSSRTGGIVLLALYVLAVGMELADHEPFELSDLLIPVLLVVYLGWAQMKLRTVGGLLTRLDGVGSASW